MHVVYVLKHSASGNLYIGRTENLKRRLREHNSGSVSSTKRRVGKWVCVYAEAYLSKEDAILRERKLKAHGSAKHALLKRAQFSLKVIEGKN